MEQPQDPYTLPRKFWKDLENQLGKPYRFGAEADVKDDSPTQFDCSELCEWAYRRIGVQIPDGSANQYNFTEPRPDKKGYPGDLAFFADPIRFASKDNPHGVYHSGIVFHDGKNIIEARAPWTTRDGDVLYGKVTLVPMAEWEKRTTFAGYRSIPDASLEMISKDT